MNSETQPAPELMTTDWLNVPHPIALAGERGRVVVIEAFQMLCPGCVSHGLPQAQRIAETFSRDDVTVLGLHTVFEHHEAQGTRAALEAFLHEYRIGFPVAIDAPSERHVPKTMAAYHLRGTPSLLLIDRQGRLRQQYFGSVPDLLIGAQIMQLVGESSLGKDGAVPDTKDGCREEGCAIPRHS